MFIALWFSALAAPPIPVGSCALHSHNSWALGEPADWAPAARGTVTVADANTEALASLLQATHTWLSTTLPSAEMSVWTGNAGAVWVVHGASASELSQLLNTEIYTALGDSALLHKPKTLPDRVLHTYRPGPTVLGGVPLKTCLVPELMLPTQQPGTLLFRWSPCASSGASLQGWKLVCPVEEAPPLP